MLKATLGVGLGAHPTAATPAIITGKDRGRGPERERSTTVTRVDTTGKCIHTLLLVTHVRTGSAGFLFPQLEGQKQDTERLLNTVSLHNCVHTKINFKRRDIKPFV